MIAAARPPFLQQRPWSCYSGPITSRPPTNGPPKASVRPTVSSLWRCGCPFLQGEPHQRFAGPVCWDRPHTERRAGPHPTPCWRRTCLTSVAAQANLSGCQPGRPGLHHRWVQDCRQQLCYCLLPCAGRPMLLRATGTSLICVYLRLLLPCVMQTP